MSNLEALAKRYEEGKVKDQLLEYVVFDEVYGQAADKLQEACRAAATIRCEALEKKTGVQLPLIKKSGVDNVAMGNGTILAGIEKKIGAAIIPMGFAGPIKINGEFAKGEFYIPLATNEAALVAGMQRGMKAINLAGGINTIVTFDGMARAPLLQAPDLASARAFCRRVVEDRGLLETLGKQIKDPFVKLDYIDPYQLGTKVFIRIICKTGDAMGMNGVTKAAADISRKLIELLPDWKLLTISSNMCCDKKSSHVNILNGRGKSVQAEVFIPEEALQKVFKPVVTARKVEQLIFNKCYLGSCLSGTLGGFNVNASNTIAAFFAATGQDLAHVVSSSTAFLQAEARDGGLHYMVSLPTLEIATIGGGTNFGTAKEALRLLGCGGFGKSFEDNTNVKRLAEIAIAAVAALDLNTTCAQVDQFEMADSHVKFARGEKDK